MVVQKLKKGSRGYGVSSAALRNFSSSMDLILLGQKKPILAVLARYWYWYWYCMCMHFWSQQYRGTSYNIWTSDLQRHL